MPAWGIVLIVVLVFFILLMIIFFSSIRIIGQTEKGIVERFGAYRTTWDTGFHLKVPFLDRLAHRIDMKEHVADFPPQSVITKDNVTMQILSLIHI